jgi:hypothetical protein
MGYYTSTILGPHDQGWLIHKYGREKVKFNWGTAQFGILYVMGFKWCDNCIVMMKIEERTCPICGRWLRTKPRGSKKKGNRRR